MSSIGMNLKAPRNGSNNLVSEENPNELVLNGNKYNLIERDSPEDVYDDGTSCGIINSRRKSYFSNTLVQQIDKRKKTFALVVGIVILVIVGVTVGCLHLIPDQRDDHTNTTGTTTAESTTLSTEIGYTQEYVCEHGASNSIDITCRGDESINVIEVWYGRKSETICPGPDYHSLTCSSNPSVSLQIAKRACQGRRSCTLTASNGVFGDPCPGTQKYLALRYTCIPNDDPFSPVVTTTSHSPFSPLTTSNTCGHGKFKCATNSQCIPSGWVCDSEDDCPDGSDENNCEDDWD